MGKKCLKEAASRYLLPMEMWAGVQAIGIGLAGPLGGGVLFHRLQETNQSLVWLLGFVLIGGSTLAVAVYEWFYGRRMALPRLFALMRVRAVVSFLALSLWLCAFALVLIIWIDGGPIVALTFILPFNAAFAWWSYHENLKVKYALDENVETPTLVFHR